MRFWPLLLAAVLACQTRSEKRADRNDAAPAPAAAVRPLGWLAVGAGGVPGDYQISIAQDLGLARAVLPGPGKVLFGSGPGASVARTRETAPSGDALVQALGELLAPRAGRQDEFVPAPLSIDLPAEPKLLEVELQRQLSVPTSAPLVLWVAGHGENQSLAMWPQTQLLAGQLVSWLQAKKAGRSVAVVLTTCFSGSFDSMVFQAGDPKRGPSRATQCGLFASTHDLPADGCDPNPDRRKQEGYGIHALNALRRRDRAGRLDPSIDSDGDGRISLLEAHSRARIASQSANVPTTTSERYLREVARKVGKGAKVELPEERAVIAGLARRLGLPAADLATLGVRAETELRGIESRIAALAKDFQAAKLVEDSTYKQAAGELLARWPVLDDPWHPAYQETLARERAAIQEHLARSSSYSANRRAVLRVSELDAAQWKLRTEAAPWENLVRAVRTLRLAETLAARGGPQWKHYRALLQCERAVPRAP